MFQIIRFFVLFLLWGFTILLSAVFMINFTMYYFYPTDSDPLYYGVGAIALLLFSNLFEKRLDEMCSKKD